MTARTGLRRRALVVGAVLAVATVAGACSGGGSGESEARLTTEPEPLPVTTVVATTAAQAPTTVPPTTRPTATPTPTTTPRRPAAFPGIYPEYDWAALQAVEAAVAEGHQPWRTSPDDVARLYVDDQLHLVTDPASFTPTGPEGLVLAYVANGVPGAVHLERPGGSVAVVVASETSRLDGVHLTRSGDEVRVELTATAAGTVHAMAGPFQSEWTVTRSRDVTPGATVSLTLDTGLGDAPLLIRLRHEAADGSVGIAERRA